MAKKDMENTVIEKILFPQKLDNVIHDFKTQISWNSIVQLLNYGMSAVHFLPSCVCSNVTFYVYFCFCLKFITAKAS